MHGCTEDSRRDRVDRRRTTERTPAVLFVFVFVFVFPRWPSSSPHHIPFRSPYIRLSSHSFVLDFRAHSEVEDRDSEEHIP